jgi:hypothetical protein
METEHTTSRLWGWDVWLRDQMLPLAAPVGGRPCAQLWILSGPTESGRNDLLRALRKELESDASYGSGGVAWISRGREEDVFTFQTRAAEILGRRPVAQVAMAGGGQRQLPDGAAGSSDADPEEARPPSFFLLRDGDMLTRAWWREQMQAWITHHPEACLCVTTGQRSEGLLEAFRSARGEPRGLFQRALGPWPDAKIAAWQEAFLPHDQRSVGELRKRSQGGWPGALWELYEAERLEAENAMRRNHLRRVVNSLSPGERECLLVAACCPAPHRDYLEVMLKREIPIGTWSRLLRSWQANELVDARGGWWASCMPEQIIGLCRDRGDDPGRLDRETRAALKQLHRFFPSEEQRRRVAPAGAFDHLDEAVLTTLFAAQGKDMWASLRALPGFRLSGGAPYALPPDFLGALQTYTERLPGGLPAGLEARIREQWEAFRSRVRDEVASFGQKREALQKRVEKARVEMQHHEKQLEALRRKRKPLAPGRSRRRPSPTSADHSRQVLGGVGIVTGIGWMYLSFIQHNGFSLYSSLGSFALLFIGFGFAFGGNANPADESQVRAQEKKRAAAADALEQAITREMDQFVLSRDLHDQLFQEAHRGQSRARQLEESLRRPYRKA